MEKFRWPYPLISREDFLAKLALAENLLQKYGAVFVGDVLEHETWIKSNGSTENERSKKHVWIRENEYIRVGKVYFLEKPFLVIEFSDKQEGPYEDSEPFPFDLPDAELEREIRCALGIETD